MKKDPPVDKLTIMQAQFSQQQGNIVKDCCKQTKEIPCFELEGALFIGVTRYTAAILFAHDNPTGADFYVWCQDNLKMVVAPSK